MNSYKGIEVHKERKLYNDNGTFNRKITRSLDSLNDKLKERGHTLLSAYKDNQTKVLIDFYCGHEPHWIAPRKYKEGQGCSKCSLLHTEETRRKISEANKNLSPEKRERIIEGIRNNRYTESYGKKLSESKLGENNGQAILTEEQAREIKRLWNRKKYSAQVLGDMFGVSRQCASSIVHGRTWKHVKVDEE